MSIYILKKSDFEITAVYYSGGNICIRNVDKGLWGRETIVAKGVKREFSIFEQNDEIMILYQHLNGDIFLWGEHKEPVKILESISNTKNDIVINAEIWGSQMEIIYNLPHSKDECIVRQRKRAESNWSSPEKIDDFVPFNNHLFSIHYAGKNNKVIFYQKRMPEIQFGYREIGENIGGFKLVYATGFYITDYSYVITDECIHFVFLLSGLYGSKIVYVRKEKGGISKAKTIAENTGAKDCITAVIQNKIYIWWKTAKRLYFTLSYDIGESFKSPCIYKGEFENNSVKAVLMEKNQTGDKYIANQVYVPSDRPYAMELLPVEGIIETKSLQDENEINRLRQQVRELEMRIRGK